MRRCSSFPRCSLRLPLPPFLHAPLFRYSSLFVSLRLEPVSRLFSACVVLADSLVVRGRPASAMRHFVHIKVARVDLHAPGCPAARCASAQSCLVAFYAPRLVHAQAAAVLLALRSSRVQAAAPNAFHTVPYHARRATMRVLERRRGAKEKEFGRLCKGQIAERSAWLGRPGEAPPRL